MVKILHPSLSSLRQPAFEILLGLVLAVLLPACAGPLALPTSTPEPESTAFQVDQPTATPTPSPSPTPCAPNPILVPTLPAEIPGYTQLDPATNLHVTGRSFEVIDLESYLLEVNGLVDRPLSLSYADLRCMPRMEKRVELVCLGFFEDEATWAGVSLIHILDLAGVQAAATEIEMTGADGYSNTLAIEQALRPSNFLAYEWEGEPLPVLHGFPLRGVFPGEYGARWVKWLVKIEVK